MEMVAAINTFGNQNKLKQEWNDAVSFVNALQQRENDNNCGAALSECGRWLQFSKKTLTSWFNGSTTAIQADEIWKFVLGEGRSLEEQFMLYVCEKKCLA